jgi:hypothetical protein
MTYLVNSTAHTRESGLPPAQYGRGIEAKRAQRIRSRPEVAEFAGSIHPSHWAYRSLEEIIGASKMKLRHLRDFTLKISRTFPDHVLKAERDLVRTWDGCVYYLLRHRGFLVEVCRMHRTGDEPTCPMAVGALKILLPPITVILDKIEQCA